MAPLGYQRLLFYESFCHVIQITCSVFLILEMRSLHYVTSNVSELYQTVGGVELTEISASSRLLNELCFSAPELESDELRSW